MMHLPRTHFVASAAMPVERTIFHADGSRTVVGDLGSVTYGADGAVAFSAHAPDVLRSDHTRWDLAA